MLYEQACARASANIGRFVDAFATACAIGAQRPIYVPIDLPKAQPIKRKRTSPRRIKASLGALLENVEEAFESASLPMLSYAALPKELGCGLRSMGPWVPYGSPWEQDSEPQTTIDPVLHGGLPGIFCLSRGAKSEHFDGLERPEGRYAVVAFAAGQKLEKAPWYVEQVPGIHYSFWMGFRLRKRIEWVDAQFVIDPVTGHVRTVGELHSQQVPLPNGERYSKRVWLTPLVDQATAWGNLRTEREMCARDIFIQVLKWWMRRNERWVVAVRKNKRRVTFSVDEALTKEFFRDRDKTARTESGAVKRIIHYVQEHERIVPGKGTTMVREHIRGLNKFLWRGYNCTVIAPKFHAFTIGGFTFGALDEEDYPPNKAFIDAAQLGRKLANLEDAAVKIQRRKHG